MNISKEINKEYKINVKELTKQAVKTIKAFQNNNKKRNHQVDFNLKIILQDNKSTFEDFELIFKNNNRIFSLEVAINEIICITDNLKKHQKNFLLI